MGAALLTDKDSELLHWAALFAAGIVTIEEAAAGAESTVSDFTDKLENPVTLAQLECHIAKNKTTGKTSEARALAMLDRLLDVIEPQIVDLSPSSATRVAEILLKISGLQDRRAAEIKKVAPVEGSGFSISINLGGYVPEVTRTGGVSRVIDAEVVEVLDADD